jgi:hypothetical protein
MKRLSIAFALFTLSLLATPNAGAQTKVTRSVSNDAIEAVLKGMQLKYTKTEPKDKDSSMHFEFLRGDKMCRLKNYGTDIWIECIAERNLKLEDVNRWNQEAKFSRLVFIEENKKTILSLEAQLDCVGGVTDAMIRQFITRFDEEAKRFFKFAN